MGLALLLACHALGLLLFPPRMPTISDELHYVQQAVAFAHGETTVQVRDARSGELHRERPSRYPPGTSLLLTPLVFAFGPQAAPWLGWLSLAAMVVITWRLIAYVGGAPGTAVLLAAFLPSAVLCRHAMSDLPSGAWMAAVVWLFMTGADGPRSRRRLRWWLAGLLAGASLLLREPNPLLVAPLFAGAIVRREEDLGWLVTGGVLGLSLRPLTMWLLFDAPFDVMSHPGFSPANLLWHLPFYLLMGSVLLPGGIPAMLAYRGPRFVELMVTSALWLLLFGCYGYAGEASGLSKSLVLGGRFLIPVGPLWVLALSVVGPRWLRSLGARAPRALAGFERRALSRTAHAVLAGFVLALHATMGQWGAAQARMRDAVYEHTPQAATLIALPGAGKLVSPLYGERAILPVSTALRSDGSVSQVLSRSDLFVIEVSRSDSEHWRRVGKLNARLRAAITALGPSEKVLELRATAADRLTIWRVRGSSAGSKR